MSVEKTVIEHYERPGQAERILELARAKAADPANLTTEDLALYDDMHIGGRKATAHLMEAMGFRPGMKVLDIGSGLGGAARHAAQHYNVYVTGLDLTPGYKEVSDKLSGAVGLADKVAFVTGDGRSLPFEDSEFDAAYVIHTGMNVPDKAGFYGAIAKVLKPGAAFGIYDVMAGQGGHPAFPLPWADTQASSFLQTPDAIENLLKEAGFKVDHRENRRDFALGALERLQKHDIFKDRNDDFPVRIGNLKAGIEKGQCAPHVFICRKI